jgi:hypothetical protein
MDTILNFMPKEDSKKDRTVRKPYGDLSLTFKWIYRVQNGSEAHPAFYPVGSRGSFPGGKAAGA